MIHVMLQNLNSSARRLQFFILEFLDSWLKTMLIVIRRKIFFTVLNYNCITLRYVDKFRNMQALQFPRGNIYQIICQDGNHALRIQTNNPNEYNKARIVGAAPNANDIGQLFMI